MNSELIALLSDPDVQQVSRDPLRYTEKAHRALAFFGDRDPEIALMIRLIDKIERAL